MPKRAAFTLLEIVFTIILLGIIATGFPMLLTNDMDTKEETIIQEAFYASTAKMSQILSFHWDDNSLRVTNSTVSMSRILEPTLGDSELDRNQSKFRIGHFRETGRRSLYDINDTNRTPSPGLGLDEGAVALADDIDDFVGNDQVFIEGTNYGTSNTGYKGIYRVDITVNYVEDNNTYTNTTLSHEFESAIVSGGQSTNIKRINIRTTEQQSGNFFDMITYSANIGETTISSRVFN